MNTLVWIIVVIASGPSGNGAVRAADLNFKSEAECHESLKTAQLPKSPNHVGFAFCTRAVMAARRY